MGTRRRGHHSRPNHMPRPRTWRARRSRTARSLPPLLRPPTRQATGQRPLPATPARIGWASCVRPRRRTGPARPAHVSGRPPWDPAPRPDSELPWAQAPAPPRGGAESLPKREQVRPEPPSWDAVAEDVWPGGPRSAALHPPVPPPADRSPGLVGRPGRLATGGTAGTAAMGYGRATRPMPGAGLVPPKANYPERARPGEERPNPDAGVEPFRAAGAEPAPAADGASQPGAGPGPATASKPADAAASPPADAAASPPGTPLPRRLATPPLRPPTPSLPSQPGTDSGGFRGTAQASFPFAARPATKPGAAGTWQPNAGAGPFPAATDTPAAGTGLPGTGSAEPGGPAPWGGGSSTVSAADASGAGSTFPQEGGPSADNPQPASGVPPWGITDSPSAPAEGTVQADAEPTAPGPLSDAPAAGTGNAETGDSTETFAAVDPAAERSFPPAHPGDSSESFPATRPRADDDAFRLFPPVRETDNHPPAPPATGDQD